jgi:hypothetical protein
VTFAEHVRLNYLSDNGGAPLSNTPPPACLKLNVTANENVKLSAEEIGQARRLRNKEKGLLHFTPERDDVKKVTHYNFKVKCRINLDSFVVAKVDTDSHLNLISAYYFELIKKKGSDMFLNEQPMEYLGLGTRLWSKYSPVILSIQIGLCVFRARFIVSRELTSNPVLIGSDFLVKNEEDMRSKFEPGIQF